MLASADQAFVRFAGPTALQAPLLPAVEALPPSQLAANLACLPPACAFQRPRRRVSQAGRASVRTGGPAGAREPAPRGTTLPVRGLSRERVSAQAVWRRAPPARAQAPGAVQFSSAMPAMRRRPLMIRSGHQGQARHSPAHVCTAVAPFWRTERHRASGIGYVQRRSRDGHRRCTAYPVQKFNHAPGDQRLRSDRSPRK